jgi:hypothetical protein
MSELCPLQTRFPGVCQDLSEGEIRVSNGLKSRLGARLRRLEGASGVDSERRLFAPFQAYNLFKM